MTRDENKLNLEKLLVKVNKTIFVRDEMFSNYLDDGVSVQETANHVINYLANEIYKCNALGRRETKIQNYSIWIGELSNIALHDIQ